ncbi:hypothetical protein SAMN05444170_6913 [Bradyrhizobium erythrophlei]|uniref:Uncharacterized protein n=1 Tax=Bradyrhizobium erythrophlei TaxID=1437360 RepID=A0A1M7UVA3_9BRAD|nr:hypothetical protein SAMN05444170_6913 [Bradyrhizobium erythrophlei]
MPIWQFLRQKTNREVLAWLGGGFVVLAAGAWTVFVYLTPPKSMDRPSVRANCGGVAIGGNVTGATISGATSGSDCPNESK